MTDLYARRRDTIMAAHEAGVPLYAGTDGGGSAAARQHRRRGPRAGRATGCGNEAALGAASWRAREWLGWNASLDEGAPADFVVYDADPLADLSVLARPACVVLRGRVVRRPTPWANACRRSVAAGVVLCRDAGFLGPARSGRIRR